MVDPELNEWLAEACKTAAASPTMARLCLLIRTRLEALMLAEYNAAPRPLTLYLARTWQVDGCTNVDVNDAVLNELVTQIEFARPSRSSDWTMATLPGQMRWWEERGRSRSQFNVARAIFQIVRANPSVRAIRLQVPEQETAYDDVGTHDDNAEDWLARRKQLVPLLRALPYETGRVMSLALQGLNAGQIAAELGKAANTVRRQLRRGVDMLRDLAAEQRLADACGDRTKR